MGYNTVAFMLNDMASDLEKEPELGTFLRGCMSSGRGGSIGQKIEVLRSEHADTQQIIMAGGNRVTTVALAGWIDHTPEALLRFLAADLGYSLRKKGTRHDR